MKSRPAFRIALAWLALVVLLALAAPWVAGESPTRPVGGPLEPPGSGRLLGTDALGRDQLARLLWGARVSLGAALVASALTIGLGGLAGVIAALAGGWAERLILGAANALLAIPGLLLALLLVAGLGPGLPAAVLAVGLGGAPGFARMSRTAFLQVLQHGYIAAATALGSGPARLAAHHVLPNARASLLALGATHLAWSLLGITTLAFLGLSGDPSTPEWGSMLNAGRADLASAPWLALAPGLMISLTLLSVYALAEAAVRPSPGAR